MIAEIAALVSTYGGEYDHRMGYGKNRLRISYSA